MALRIVGIRPLIGEAMKAMFADSFLKGDEFSETRDIWRRRILANDSDALVRFGKAIFARDDVLDALGSLDLPVHVVMGEHDRGIPLDDGRAIARTIPGARFSLIEGAGHLCTIERPAEVTIALTSFIDGH